MSMHSEQDHEPALRRLLALKKHEQPPPGYFNSFSSRVIARIEAGERSPDSAWEWLSQLWTAFETKPLLAGALGVTFCGLITTGFLFSDRASGLQAGPVSVYAPNQPLVLQMSTPAASPLFGQMGLDGSSTGNVDAVQVQRSLFQDLRQPSTKMVTFTLPGSN